jgi:hypothetical protein
LIGLGFEPSIEGSHSVLYKNRNGVFARVFQDSRDRFVGFRVGLTARSRDALTSSELARLSGAKASNRVSPEDIGVLRAVVRQAARELIANGDRVLSGDESNLDEPWS